MLGPFLENLLAVSVDNRSMVAANSLIFCQNQTFSQTFAVGANAMLNFPTAFARGSKRQNFKITRVRI